MRILKRLIRICSPKLRGFFMCFAISICFYGYAMAEGVEIGTSYCFEFAAGDMNEHEVGNVGVSLEFKCPLPLNLSGRVLSDMGISVEAGFLLPVDKASYVDSWWILDFASGLYFDLMLNKEVSFRPELGVDARLNFVESDERNVHGLNMDFGAKLGFSFVMDLFGIDLLFRSGADYIILPERDNICHYVSLNAGVSYRFNLSKDLEKK